MVKKKVVKSLKGLKKNYNWWRQKRLVVPSCATVKAVIENTQSTNIVNASECDVDTCVDCHVEL